MYEPSFRMSKGVSLFLAATRTVLHYLVATSVHINICSSVLCVTRTERTQILTIEIYIYRANNSQGCDIKLLFTES